jgi:hypothetical protein
MPITLDWHPSLPVIIAAYSGTITADDFAAMCERRHQMLDERGGRVVLVVDVRAMDSLTNGAMSPCHDILQDERVARVLIVLKRDLYRHLLRNFRHAPRRAYRAGFYDSLEAALCEAESLA